MLRVHRNSKLYPSHLAQNVYDTKISRYNIEYSTLTDRNPRLCDIYFSVLLDIDFVQSSL